MVIRITSKIILAAQIMADKEQHVTVAQGEEVWAHVVFVVLRPFTRRFVERMKIVPVHQIVGDQKINGVARFCSARCLDSSHIHA